jgi:type 1 glutamine amidotransferase/HEAT repeat protein
MKLRVTILTLFLILCSTVFAINDDELGKIRSAAPDKAVTPAKARKVLVFSLTQGFKHSSMPYCSAAIDIIGKKTGAYTVFDTTDKSVFTAKSLKKYDVIVFNNTVRLTFDDAQKKAIMDFVKGGKGIVGIHGATDNFYGWDEAIEMMGGTFDGHPWTAGGTWKVRIEDADHAVMKSFDGKDFQINDEIYRTKTVNLRGNARVLMGLDMSDEVNLSAGGIRKGENDVAISWVRDFGKGRVFYSSLGHNHHLFWNRAVLSHYLAGIQFAAGDLKADTTPLAFDGAYLAEIDGLDEMLATLCKFENGKDTAVLRQLQGVMKKAMSNDVVSTELETKFIGLLSGDATLTAAAKQIICQQLGLIGTEASTEILAKMVSNPATTDMARYAAERISSAKIDKMLITAAGKTSGNVKIGIVNTLGVKQVEGAVSKIGKMIKASDADLSLAAIEALKKIGNEKAMKALASSMRKLKGSLKQASVDAYLYCADQKLASGDISKALKAYKRVNKSTDNVYIRAAAVKGIIAASGNKKDEFILGVFKDDDKAVRDIATAALTELSATELKPILKRFDEFNDAAKIQVIAAIAKTKSAEVLAVVTAASDNPNKDVRLQAIEALATAGDGSTVKVLSEKAATARGHEQRLARQSLYGLVSPDADKVILGNFAAANAGVKVELLRAIGERRIDGGGNVLLVAVKDSDSKVRVEALKVASGSLNLDQSNVLAALSKAQMDQERRQAGKTLVAMANKGGNKAAQVAGLVAFKTSSPDVKSVILISLGEIGDDQGLELLLKSLKSSDDKVQYGAIIGLTQWPNADAAESLLDVAEKTALNNKNKLLALRGAVGLVAKSNSMPSSQVIEMLTLAMELAPNTSEKRKVLSTLGSSSSKGAMDMAAKYLDDAALKGEAEIAVVNIASRNVTSYPEDVKIILKKVLSQTKSKYAKEKSETTLKAIDTFAGCVVAWQLAGPYTEGDLFDTSYAPETDPASVSWRRIQGDTTRNDAYIFDFRRLLGGNDRAVYVRTYVWADQAKKAELLMGSDDGVIAWVNGKKVHSNDLTRGVRPGSDKVVIDLKQGYNELMLKNVQHSGGWGVCAQIKKVGGGICEGIRIVTSKQ